jgi:hypothetical protein
MESAQLTSFIIPFADLNLGNGYNKANGKFTTPMNGTYVFRVATGAIDQSHASVELVVNGIIKDVSCCEFSIRLIISIA